MSTSGLSDSSFRYEKFEVSLIQSMTVQPCQPTKRHIMSLSGFDRVSPALMYTVFFYKAGCDEDEEKMNDGIVETIRKALEKVLVSWYPAAGRFRINEETGKLELDCNEAGSVLVEACTSATLEDLGRLSDYKPFYEKLVPKLSPSRDDLSENPLLVAQITRFGCGSLSLGFGSSHALFDGVGAFNFLKAWASLSSGSIDESQELLAPNHSRDHLLTSAATNESIYNQYNSMPVQDLYGIPMSAKASDDKSWETTLFELSNLYQGGYDLKTFLVKQEIIDSLKKKASGSGQLSVCSSFDVLTAQAQRLRGKLAREISENFKDIDAFIGNATDWEKVCLGNLVGMPVIVVPTGLKNITAPPHVVTPWKTTVTTGIYGAPYHDSEVLALAMAYQEVTNHNRQRPPIDN